MPLLKRVDWSRLGGGGCASGGGGSGGGDGGGRALKKAFSDLCLAMAIANLSGHRHTRVGWEDVRQKHRSSADVGSANLPKRLSRGQG